MVERYVDFLLMGFLFLEHRRLADMKKAGAPSQRAGEPCVQARVTDRLRDLESLIQQWNLERIEEALETKAGRRRLLKELPMNSAVSTGVLSTSTPFGTEFLATKPSFSTV